MRKIAYITGIRKHETTATYNLVIPAEIKEGCFYDLISQFASKRNVVTILEIGSSSGTGSTRALYEAIHKNIDNEKQVHCMEISSERFVNLKEYLKEDSRFHPHKLSSVKISDFPDFREVVNFHEKKKTKFSNYHLDTVTAWYEKDIKFLEENVGLIPENKDGEKIGGIEWIKQEYSVENFDFVIIDGGEFTGMIELSKVIGANNIALDDINSYKCFEAHEFLMNDLRYELIAMDEKERNGWSFFTKKSEESTYSTEENRYFNFK